MDKDLARTVATAAVKSCSNLVNLVPLLKGRCDPQTYATYLAAIASVSGHVTDQILNPLFAQYPDLRSEFDASIAKNGKL